MSEKRELLINTINKTLQNVVLGAGFAQLNVRSVSEDIDGGRTIINLSGCTDYQRKEIIKALQGKKNVDAFSEDELQEIANMNATYSFPTDWLLRDNKPFVPAQGDAVKALFASKFSENQGTDILVVDRIQTVGDASTSSFKIEDAYSGKMDMGAEKSEAKQVADEVLND